MNALQLLRAPSLARVLMVVSAFFAFTAQAQTTATPPMAPKAAATSAAAKPAAKAATEQAVTADLTQVRVLTDANGKESFEDASAVTPGTVIEYRVKYVNHGKTAVSNFTANLPIPRETEYLPKSATPGAPRVTAATEDGKFAREPLMRTVPGKAQPEPVPYEQYRALRWDLGQLPPGGVIEVRARVRVQAFVPPAKSEKSAPQPAEPAPAR